MGKKGFTLIEIMVAISIIAILSLIGLINYQNVVKSGRDAKRQSDLRALQSTLEQYRSDQGYYPDDNFNTILANGQAFTNCSGRKGGSCSITRTYLSEVPVDPNSSTPYCYRSEVSRSNDGNCDYTLPGATCYYYSLCAKMENSSELDSCICNSGYNFKVSPP